MDQVTEAVWLFTVKQRNIRSELVAVAECRRGNSEPLLLVLSEYGLPPEVAIAICLGLRTHKKPPKMTKRFLLGYDVERRLRQHPGIKKQIVKDVAKGVSEKTVQNYHDHFLKSLKQRGWTRADLDQFRARTEPPSSL
jgi:hypothetical protein